MPVPLSGYRYASVYALLLDVGRLFTPARWPSGPPPGEPGKCYIEAASWAWGATDAPAYVEGMAWTGLFPIEHAWCSTRSGTVLDPTWEEPGSAYLGLPVKPTVAVDLMRRHGDALLTHGPVTREWMRDGVPPDILMDVGRPVPKVDA